MAAVGIGRVPAGRGLCCRRSLSYGYGRLRLSDAEVAGEKGGLFWLILGKCVFLRLKFAIQIAEKWYRFYILKETITCEKISKKI